MITSTLLTIFYSVISFFTSLLPAGQALPTQWTTAVATVWGYLNAWNYIFPVSSFLTILTLAMSFHLGIYAWHLIRYVIKLIRGHG